MGDRYRPTNCGDAGLDLEGYAQATQPSLILLMLNALDLQPDARVLEVGTATGYQAALLSQLAADVVTMDVLESVSASAQHTLHALGCPNVAVVVGDGSEGHAESAPYDAIVVSAAALRPAEAWLDQLTEGGVLVAPLAIGLIGPQLLAVLRRQGDHLVGGFQIPVPLQGRLAPRRVHSSEGEHWILRSHLELDAELVSGEPVAQRSQLGSPQATALSVSWCAADGWVV